MLTAALVRLDIAWSARPQLSRPAIWRGRCQGVACDARWLPVAVCRGGSGPACSAPEASTATTVGAAVRAAGVHRPSAGLLRHDLGAWRGERAVGLTAQHLIDEPGGQQPADAPQPHKTWRGEIVVGQTM